MARNSSGTYSLYTPGNPVVTSTPISSTWANNTLTDIATALTDSLSRSGDGGMSVPLELTNGSAAAPSLTFASSPTVGLYCVGADQLGVSTSGTVRYVFGASGQLGIGGATYGTAGQMLTSGGSGAPPTWSSGPANPSATIGLSAINGSASTFIRSDGAPALSQAIAPTWTNTHTFQAVSLFAAGSAGAPSLAGAADTNTGVVLPGSDVFAISTGGSTRLQVGASGQLGIGGATYGTAGNVLISGGAGAPPTWGYGTFSTSGTATNQWVRIATKTDLGRGACIIRCWTTGGAAAPAEAEFYWDSSYDMTANELRQTLGSSLINTYISNVRTTYSSGLSEAYFEIQVVGSGITVFLSLTPIGFDPSTMSVGFATSFTAGTADVTLATASISAAKGAFYVTTAGTAMRGSKGAYLSYDSATNSSGLITVSTSAASGTPGAGDIWLQYV